MQRFSAWLVIGIILAVTAAAQAPSQEEQQYLFSVLPLIDRGDFSQAEQKLSEGIELFPRSAILFNALGIVYRKQEKLEPAARSFRKALEILPSFTAAQLQLAALDRQQGDKEGATQLFRAAAEGTTNFDALVTAGLGLADCENYPGAVLVLQKAHALRPDAASVTYNLALAQYKSGDLAASLNTLREAGSTEPDVVYLRGRVLEALGRTGAAKELAAACRMQPANETFCANAATAAIREDKFGDALDLLQPALEKSPGSVAILSAAALAQFRLGRYADATRSYSAALEKDPALDAAREGLGFLYYMTGNLEKARSVVEEGLKNSRADYYLAHLDAMVLYRLSPQLRSQALAAVDRAIRSNPQFAPSYFLRGKIRLDQKNDSGALDDFECAVAIDAKYSLPYYKMAQIYSKQGRAREAEIARKKFSELGSMREEETLARQAQDVLMPAAR